MQPDRKESLVLLVQLVLERPVPQVPLESQGQLVPQVLARPGLPDLPELMGLLVHLVLPALTGRLALPDLTGPQGLLDLLVSMALLVLLEPLALMGLLVRLGLPV